jgi:hypothetical protein
MRALADGLSPETGEVLSADLVYQYAPVVRAFHRAVGALEIVGAGTLSQSAGDECRQIVVAG